ncbi:hypothetical protein DFJ67_7961 [Asanoa ferruginea]|uniref:Nucleoside 2-deoxyribosyltransferase-like protein n=1 Tax=Asanoa ferruginea TaxID=53367 RepID=A0A3D9ZXM7_9ACTN|nr:hypothetical protein [Asanoa ferruginea]REG01872.1 hypothetical protein DFJ67_7961 [Asanoa ferruginea]GIF50251.1 hypothetical protein Afe04nite_47900 [Asanoa ferruginea]
MTDPQPDATNPDRIDVASETTNEVPRQRAEPKKAPPTKRSPAKKTPAKKARIKKVAAKKSASGKRVASAAAAHTIKYPRHSVEQALRIPRAIYQQNAGRPATPSEAVTYAGGGTLNGQWNVEISSGKKYGFLATDGGRLVLTERARRALAPQSAVDRVTALQEAVLAAPDISDVYNHYRGEYLPANTQFFVNALVDRFKIPPDKVDDFIKIFMESMRSAELLDDHDDQTRLIDAGRDEAHRPADGKPAPKAKVAAGTRCFVMQPFAAPLGTYYETIYKPAIEQAGLEPVRADDSIFGAGKIIDQIWRGIRGAKVLIAELTTKNPNVFYELGLAHALQKPVILVSSNDDDVPFDLRHLRYIKYDKEDPFWGPKLIDKIADNIKLAIADPEEAIFPLDESA